MSDFYNAKKHNDWTLSTDSKEKRLWSMNSISNQPIARVWGHRLPDI